MPRKIGRELGRDHQVDGAAVALAEVQQPPRRRMRQDLVLRIPLEGQRHPIGGDAARAQLSDQLLDEQLRAAAHQRNLRLADQDGAGSASTWRGGS